MTGRVGWPWYPWQTLQASGRNRLPLLVKEAGYVTQLLGDCPHLMKSRFDIGFDGFHYLRGQEGVRMNDQRTPWRKPMWLLNVPVAREMQECLNAYLDGG